MNKLKQIRESRGLSQSELAEKSGVKRRMIQAYEQDYKDINGAHVETVVKLADALGCDVRDIIDSSRL